MDKKIPFLKEIQEIKKKIEVLNLFDNDGGFLGR